MSLRTIRLLLLSVVAFAAAVVGLFLLLAPAPEPNAPVAGMVAQTTDPQKAAAPPTENAKSAASAPTPGAPMPDAPMPDERTAAATAPSNAPATAPPIVSPAEDPRRAVEAKIAAAPDIARFFDRLRLTLPNDYEKAAAGLVKLGETGTADVYLSEAVKSLRQSRGAAAAKADAAPLSQVFAKQLQVLEALSARDPKICVDFLYGGASEAIFKFAADNRALVSDLAIAGLDAILDGEQKKIARGGPNEADFQLLEKALREKGLSAAEIEALLDGKTPDPPLPDDKMCAAGKTYLQTLATLPEATRLRIYALAVELMARG